MMQREQGHTRMRQSGIAKARASLFCVLWKEHRPMSVWPSPPEDIPPSRWPPSGKHAGHDAHKSAVFKPFLAADTACVESFAQPHIDGRPHQLVKIGKEK
jgi:hypothetical protein